MSLSHEARMVRLLMESGWRLHVSSSPSSHRIMKVERHGLDRIVRQEVVSDDTIIDLRHQLCERNVVRTSAGNVTIYELQPTRDRIEAAR